MESNEHENKVPKYDPAGETKQKLIFALVAVALLVVLKFAMGM